ncbi:hypothetical protein EDB84DRAFT_1441803 [Lactarius hengduanensis]|nr:hypothetical protein EDB84DRAFT_1441803 [Lactarius hengduanensis]
MQHSNPSHKRKREQLQVPNTSQKRIALSVASVFVRVCNRRMNITVGVARRAEVALRRFLCALRKWRCGGSCAPCRGGVAAALARCKGWWWRRTCVWRWVGGGGDGLVCCKVEAEAATGT